MPTSNFALTESACGRSGRSSACARCWIAVAALPTGGSWVSTHHPTHRPKSTSGFPKCIDIDRFEPSTNGGQWPASSLLTYWSTYSSMTCPWCCATCSARLKISGVECGRLSRRSAVAKRGNAHATVREPMWWKGFVDGISIEFPRVSLWLLCSTAYRKTVAYHVWQVGQWERDNGFVVTL